MKRTWAGMGVLISMNAISGAAVGPAEGGDGAFEALRAQAWAEAFLDPGAANWKEKWFLDGDGAKVSNDDGALTIDTANGFAVLWTQQSFEGDLRIEYDFRRADTNNSGVNIIYIQATGDEEGGHVRDISQWSDRRTKAAMSDYFDNMHTYHISYATANGDYVRARRYLPLSGQGLTGTTLTGEYTDAGLFEDHQWIHITIIKQAKELWIEFRHPDKVLLCHFTNDDKPPIEEGRIGLRLMPKRLSQFRNIRIMTAGAPRG